jgi:hypothetical protein
MPDAATWEAGPDTDVEIARQVLSERIGQYETDGGPHRFIQSFGLVRDIPPFSTEIGAAWQVVEHLRDRGFLVRVLEHPEASRPDSTHRRAWLDRRSECLVEQQVRGVRRRVGHGYASTAALAICRAALATVAAPK